jgi:hypothetical protein
MLNRFALLVLCTSLAASAQDARGRISGRVLDPAGAAVPNIEVVALNPATGVRVLSKTNEVGVYELPFLNPGIYTLSVAAAGFRSYERTNLEVRVADRLTVDIPLEVGQVTESVTVSGQASLLETSTASVGRVVDTKRILDLPLPGGNALSLSRLAPGVVNLGAPNHPSLGPATEVLSNLSVNGVRNGNIEFTVDGTPSMWGTNASFAPPTEMVAEFKVQTATYDASVGRAPGGNVNVVLRSGTNQFHSTLYWFHNNQHLQSLDLFQRQQFYNPVTGPPTDEKEKSINPLNILNRYGATFSGPVFLPKVCDGRNKTFWVYSFEGLTRPGVERGSSFMTVPTNGERRGDFSELLRAGSVYQVYDPLTTTPAPGGRFARQPFAGNIIPQARLDKTALGLLPYWPESNIQGTSDGRNNYTRLQRSWNEFRTHSVKVDHNFNEKHRLFGRYSQWFQLFTSGQTFENIANGNDRWRRNYGGVVDDVYVLSPTMLNNIRAGFTRMEQSFFPLSLGFDLTAAGFNPSLQNSIDPQARSFPNIAPAGYQALGTGSNSRAFSNYFTLSDDLNWTKGKHTLKFGAEFRLYREHNYNFANMTPTINFAATYTGGPLDNSPAAPIGQGLASFLLGIPSGGQINVNDSSAEQSQTWGFYIQDDWRITNRLTINMGLRYDLDTPMTERYNRSVSNYDFTTPNPESARVIANYARNPLPELPVSQFKLNGGLLFAGAGGLSRQLWSADKNNFSPRIGIAWNVRKNTVVRAGYGLFYVPLGSDRQSVNQSGYSQRTNLVSSTDNGQTYIASLSNPFPSGWPSPPGSSLGLATDVGRGVSFFPDSQVNGYMQRYSFGIQQQLPKDFFFDVSYIANRGSSLAVSRQFTAIPNSLLSTSPSRDQQTINYLSSQVPNPFYPLPGTNIAGVNVARSQLLRPYPHFTSLASSRPEGASWYHSLQTTFERRFRQGFTFQFNYTFSKMIEANGFLNDGDANPERVISDLDRTHRWALSGIYELPFGPGRPYLANPNAFVRQLAAGWQLQTVWQANTGQPIGFGNALLLSTMDNVKLSGGEQTLDRWFNTAAFNRNPNEQLASNLQVLSTRFSEIRAPGVDTWDISAVKNFLITEKWRLQFRAEFLNAMNHSNLAAPNTAPTNTLFGRITATSGSPRYIHFGLKLIY